MIALDIPTPDAALVAESLVDAELEARLRMALPAFRSFSTGSAPA